MTQSTELNPHQLRGEQEKLKGWTAGIVALDAAMRSSEITLLGKAQDTYPLPKHMMVDVWMAPATTEDELDGIVPARVSYPRGYRDDEGLANGVIRVTTEDSRDPRSNPAELEFAPVLFSGAYITALARLADEARHTMNPSAIGEMVGMCVVIETLAQYQGGGGTTIRGRHGENLGFVRGRSTEIMDALIIPAHHLRGTISLKPTLAHPDALD